MLSSVEEASLEFSEFAESPDEDDYEYGRRLPYGMQRQAAGREADDEFKVAERKVAREDLRGGRNDLGNDKKKKPIEVRIPEGDFPAAVAVNSREDLSRKKDRKKKQRASKKHSKSKPKDKKKKNASKKLSNIKKSLRPETRKAATESDPTVLEANWPTLDVFIIVQFFNAFCCLLHATILAALGYGSDAWSYFFFALMLLVTSVPSFVLIAKSAVESAIVVYSVLQLISSLFGFICATTYFVEKEEGNHDNLGKYILLLVYINIQLFTTFMINWKPYRRVNLKKVREAFADLKDGGKAGDEESQGNKEESGITSAITSTTKSNYHFYY